jgi:hypothetical protein
VPPRAAAPSPALPPAPLAQIRTGGGEEAHDGGCGVVPVELLGGGGSTSGGLHPGVDPTRGDLPFPSLGPDLTEEAREEAAAEEAHEEDGGARMRMGTTVEDGRWEGNDRWEGYLFSVSAPPLSLAQTTFCTSCVRFIAGVSLIPIKRKQGSGTSIEMFFRC